MRHLFPDMPFSLKTLISCAVATLRVLAITAPLLVTSCFPTPKNDDDAGHAAFAYSAVPLLLGERPRGINEVEVVADISQLLGREVAARMLMKDPRFIDHWAEVLVDMLEVQREYALTLPAQDGGCWGKPTRDVDTRLARWVQRKSPRLILNERDGAPKPSWNMTDLLRSAMAIDDLSVVYRAYLFPLSIRRASNIHEDKREVLTDRLLRVYLNRDIGCLRCHNPTYSVSNKKDLNDKVVWRRLWAIPGHPEKALFGNYYGAKAVLARMHPLMRGDVRRAANADKKGRILPWGIEKDCVKETENVSFDNKGTLTFLGFQKLGSDSKKNPHAGFGSLKGANNPKASLWELEASLHQGIKDLRQGYTRFKTPAKLSENEKKYCAVVQIINSSCVGCHSGETPEAKRVNLAADDLAGELINVKKLVVPGNLRTSVLWQRIKNDSMPPNSNLSANSKSKIQTWIRIGAPHSASTSRCNTSHVPDVAADKGFAFLTATNIVDGLWTATMGSSLTIDHGYPRNADQRRMLWNLTEFEFIKKGWSLQAVLIKILTSDWYARRPPANSQANSAYTLPPLLDPWIVADPTDHSNPTASQRFNGQGAMVKRHRVNTLLRMIAKALAWNGPNRFPTFPYDLASRTNKYPDTAVKALGQFVSPKTPGFADVNFQSLLAFEAELGLCAKKGRAAKTNDWIDKLVKEIYYFNKNNPSAPITYGEVWTMLKDRLLQDPTIIQKLKVANTRSKKEELVMALFGFPTTLLSPPTKELNDKFDLNVSAVELEDRVSRIRKACGTLVKSPQFMLTNVAPRSYVGNKIPAPPRLTVCMDGEPCSYAQICTYWSRKLSDMGYVTVCGNRGIRRIPKAPPAPGHRPTQPIPGTRFAPFSLPSADAGDTVAEPIVSDAPGSPIGGPVLIDAALPAVEEPIIIDTDWLNKRAQISAVRQRVEALCPKGLCGFLKTVEVESCVTDPGSGACVALLASCDPRGEKHKDGVNSCNAPPPDIHDNGVLVAWAEGAVVKGATSVDIIHAGEWDTKRLQAQTVLKAGDFLHVPLKATIELTMHGKNIRINAMDTESVDGIRSHLIAVTGPSIREVLAKIKPRGPYEIDANIFLPGVETGKYESRAATDEDWERIIGYDVTPGSEPTPTLEEIQEINADYESLHRGLGKELD